MRVANHSSPSTHWLDTLVMPFKTALRPTQAAPVAPTLSASQAAPLTQPAPRLPQTAELGEWPDTQLMDSPLVLPASLPARMLLLSASNGITTTLALLRELQARNYQGDVVLLHVCRNPAALHQASELQGLADSYPELSLLVHFDDWVGPFCGEALRLAVPDVNERTTWMCGPRGFMEMVQAYWRSQGLTTALHSGTDVTAVHVM